MKVHIFSCVIILIFCKINKYSTSKNFEALSHDTLQAQFGIIEYAALIFRHGDRAPLFLYPTDPYQNYGLPIGFGQLTQVGKRRAYDTGKYFKPRYNCLTGEPYLPTRVIMDSSDLDRCLMTGELFYAGYYPPAGLEIWNEHLLWQPIPVHTTPLAYDYVIANTKPCPLLHIINENFFTTSSVIRSICVNYANMFIYIELNAGLEMTPCETKKAMFNLGFLQDTLLTESELNLTLPQWTHAVFPEPLTSLRAILIIAIADDPIVKRLKAGPLLNVIASDMLNIARLNNTLPHTLYTTANASQTPPLHLFSAQDINIGTIMKVLNVYQNINPPYGAAIGFELRTRDNTHFVTVVYENSTNQPLQILDIPGCSGGCTLKNFLSLITPWIPQDWEAECHPLPPETTSWKPSTTSSPTTTTEQVQTPSISKFTKWMLPSITSPLLTPTGWTPPTKPSNPSVVVINDQEWTITENGKKLTHTIKSNSLDKLNSTAAKGSE